MNPNAIVPATAAAGARDLSRFNIRNSESARTNPRNPRVREPKRTEVRAPARGSLLIALLVLISAFSLQPSALLHAATFAVINTNDSGDGSLRQAILNANITPAADAIQFGLPAGTLSIAPASALPDITAPVTINGSTQTGYSNRPLVELRGGSAGTNSVPGLRIMTSNCVVRALAIHSFSGSGIVIATNSGGNAVEGCYVGLATNGTSALRNRGHGILIDQSANNRIGGTNLASRNLVSGNLVHGIAISGAGATNNRVEGNFIGLGATGQQQGNQDCGVHLTAPLNRIGGPAVSARNVISGNGHYGIMCYAQGAWGNSIQNNIIGLDPTGATMRGNGADGIDVMSASRNLIGGAGAGNIIAGNDMVGVRLTDAGGWSNVVQGNIIGTSDSGTNVFPNGGAGIYVLNTAHHNIIGGAAPGEGNTVAFNSGYGVYLRTGTNNSIRANRIYSNTSLGIDLGEPSGVTTNDLGDADTGANYFQNYPVVLSALSEPTRSFLSGSLNSRPNTAYQLDFFTSASTDASGYGEGECYLGSSSVTTDAGGNAPFLVFLPPTSLLNWVTATATDPAGNTSEFSPAAQAGLPGTADLVIASSGPADFIPLETKVPMTVTVTNSGPAPALEVMVTNRPSGGVDITGAAPSQGSWSYSGGWVIWSPGTLAPGAGASIELTVASAIATNAQMDSRAGAQTLDANPDNNRTLTNLRFGMRDLAVAMRDAPDPLTAGQILTNTIVVTNRSDDPMPGVVLNASLPDALFAKTVTVTRGTATISASGDGFDWAIGTLAGHQGATAQLRSVTLDAGTAEVSASVSGTLNEPDYTDNSATTATDIRSGAGVLGFHKPTASTNEGGGAVWVTVDRRGGSDGTVSVSFTTEDGSAVSPADYRSLDNTITFTNGQVEQQIQVTVQEDTTNECNESFYVRLHRPQGGAALGGTPLLNFTIEDNDLQRHGWITAASVTPGPAPTTGNLASISPALSADGRWVLFTSTSSDLIPNDTNYKRDLLLRDLQDGVTRLVNVNPSGGHSGGFSFPITAALSADGCYVAFDYYATDLVPGDTNGEDDVFLWDRLAGTNRLLSVNAAGTGPGNQPSIEPRITPDGRFVVFRSYASDLVPGDLNGNWDLFHRDVLTGITTLISANATGTGSGMGLSQSPSVSTDGRYVAFVSGASDLAAGDGNELYDVFLRDVEAGTTTLVSINTNHTASGNSYSSGPAISPNGRYIAYSSRASDLVPGDTNGASDLFVFDRLTGSNRLACAVNSLSATPVFSADSRFLVLETMDDHLAANDVNGNKNDVFLLNVSNLSLTLISADCDGSGTGNAGSSSPSVNSNGTFVAFQSAASDLAPGSYFPNVTCIFLRDLKAGTTHLLSRRLSDASGPDASSSLPAISADGGTVAFQSDAADLVSNDINTFMKDVFIWSLTQPPPSLAIVRTNNQMRISWPAPAEGWVLERTNRLPSTAAPWPQLPPPYQTNAGVISVSVTNAPGATNQFFRLHKP